MTSVPAGNSIMRDLKEQKNGITIILQLAPNKQIQAATTVLNKHGDLETKPGRDRNAPFLLILPTCFIALTRPLEKREHRT